MVAHGPVQYRERDDARLGARVESAEDPLGVASGTQQVVHLQCVY